MSGFIPDLYDEQVQEGISWTLRQVGNALGASDWTEGDGTETVEGDVHVEIHNILVAAGLRCPETDTMATLAAQPSAGAQGEALVLAVTIEDMEKAALGRSSISVDEYVGTGTITCTVRRTSTKDVPCFFYKGKPIDRDSVREMLDRSAKDHLSTRPSRVEREAERLCEIFNTDPYDGEGVSWPFADQETRNQWRRVAFASLYATLAQPGTGDVKALREAFARIAETTVKRPADPDSEQSEYNQGVRDMRDALILNLAGWPGGLLNSAALSKPSAPGGASDD